MQIDVCFSKLAEQFSMLSVLCGARGQTSKKIEFSLSFEIASICRIELVYELNDSLKLSRFKQKMERTLEIWNVGRVGYWPDVSRSHPEFHREKLVRSLRLESDFCRSYLVQPFRGLVAEVQTNFLFHLVHLHCSVRAPRTRKKACWLPRSFRSL